MEQLTLEILRFLNNYKTKVELKKDFKGNYYSYITDTVYIAKGVSKKQVPHNIDKNASEVLMVCHECIHSIQNKLMRILNTIFSNLSIIFSIICIFVGMFVDMPAWLRCVTGIIILFSIIIRLLLETGAINGSIKLAYEVVSKGIVKNVSIQNIEKGSEYINRHKYLALIQMISDKIIFLILVFIIK